MTKKLSIQLMAGITLTLVLMLGANLWMVVEQQRTELDTEMHGKAKVIADQLIATRLFMARNQDRINRDTAGHFEFKGLNPAAVGRGVGTIFGEITDVTLKQTRFNVRRPENAPDPFEWEALTVFQADPSLDEYARKEVRDGKHYYRYAVPLRIEAECLRCHGDPAGTLDIAGYVKEGYKEGDLGGAISVSLPIDQAVQRLLSRAKTQVWVIVGVTAVSLLVIWLLSRRLVTRPLERLAGLATRIGNGQLEVPEQELSGLGHSEELQVVGGNMEAMARSLRELYTSLEVKVEERTLELQRANQVQTQFMATVSHELRTPLTSIIAFTELMLKQAQGRDREYLEDVLESSRRLLDMVNNLLDLNRLKAGRVQLFADLLDLGPVVAHVERTLRPLAERKHIALSSAVDTDLPPIMIDPHRVAQVLINLIGNAIKFTPEGGRVLLTVTRAEGALLVTVADTGPGVPAEHQTLVFEAFRRVENAAAMHPGSGLGLAVARELVELHGGQIWVENAPGGGSLFRFTLPEITPQGEEEDVPDAS